MNLDFNNFIKLDRHHKKVEHGAQEVKDKYALKPAETKRYLLDLFNFFLTDLEQVAEQIYSEVIHKKDKLGKQFKFTAIDLKNCIENGTLNLLPLYDRIITGYNMGGLFRTVDNLEKERKLFNDDATVLCKKQGEIYKNKYIKLASKNRREYWTFIGALIGAFAGIASVVGFKINLNLGASLSIIKSATQYLVSVFH